MSGFETQFGCMCRMIENKTYDGYTTKYSLHEVVFLLEERVLFHQPGLDIDIIQSCMKTGVECFRSSSFSLLAPPGT